MRQKRMKDIAVSALALGLLAGATVDMATVAAPADAGPYHARVREAAAVLPKTIGNWVGEDQPIDRDSLQMLRPNVILSRRYTNIVTGKKAGFLLVQVGDARDLMFHYPPICYVNQGWKRVGTEKRHWSVDGDTINGMEYEFAKSSFDGTAIMYVSNFMIMPDGRFMPDMDAIYAQAADLQRRFYGAAQIQVIPDPTMTAEQRDEVLRTLVGGSRVVIDAIRSGGKVEK